MFFAKTDFGNSTSYEYGLDLDEVLFYWATFDKWWRLHITVSNKNTIEMLLTDNDYKAFVQCMRTRGVRKPDQKARMIRLAEENVE
jgi:hypothetical protein